MAVISNPIGTPSGSYTETAVILAPSVTGNIADTLPIINVNAGWIVVGVDVIVPVGTASSTISVGDSGSATKYLNALSTATAGGTSGGVYNKYTAADTIFATLGGAALAAKAITFLVKFMRVYS